MKAEQHLKKTNFLTTIFSKVAYLHTNTSDKVIIYTISQAGKMPHYRLDHCDTTTKNHRSFFMY